MELSEIQKAKTELEYKLDALFDEFKAKTGLPIYTVDVNERGTGHDTEVNIAI